MIFAKKEEEFHEKDSSFFANFDPELYMLWSFGKATV